MSMSMSKNLDTIRTAIHAIEHTLTPPYPPHFPNIDAAKHHVQSFCDAEWFDYGLTGAYNLRSTDLHRLVRSVRDQVWFLVALLREAVERDVERVGTRVKSWLCEFADAREAAAYVKDEAARGGFEYACIESMGKERFVGYVTCNTARRAWEDGGFEMGRVLRAWEREVLKESVAKSTDHAPVGHTARTDYIKNVDDLKPGHDTSRASASPLAPTFFPETTPAESTPLTAAMTELEKKDSALVDPFKDLVAELRADTFSNLLLIDSSLRDCLW